MHVRWIVVLLALAIAGGGFLMLGHQELEAPERPRTVRPEVLPSDVQGAPDSLPDTPEAVVATPALESARFEEVAGELEEDDGGSWILVQDRSGNGVGGAVVVVTDVEAVAKPLGRGVVEPALADVTADQYGLVRVGPFEAPRIRVEAWTEDAYGSVTLDRKKPGGSGPPLPDGVDAVVVLEPVKRFVVRVQDAAGHPVPDLEVEVRPVMKNRRQSRNVNDDDRVIGWTVAPEGIATLEVTTAQAGAYRADAFQVFGRLQGQSSVHVNVFLPPDETRAEVPLTIPTTVTLAFTLVDRDGKPVAADVPVSWNARPENLNEADKRRRGPVTAGRRTAIGGRLLLAGFAPDQVVTLTTRAEGRVPETSQVRTRVDPLQEWTLVVGDPQPQVVIAILDGTGQPIAGLDVRAAMTWRPDDGGEAAAGGEAGESRLDERQSIVQAQTTDQEGRLHLTARTRALGHLRLELGKSASRGLFQGIGDGSHLLDVDLEPFAAGELRELGPVLLPEVRLLVEGEVVDAAGAPLPRELAEVYVVTTYVSRGRSGTRSMSFSTKTDDAGRFHFHGTGTGVEELAVRGRTEAGACSDWLPVTPGQREARLVVRQLGGVAGRIVKPSEAMELKIEVELSRESIGLSVPGTRLKFRCGADGSFERKGLMPGTWSLRVRVNGKEEHEFHGLVIPEGEIARPYHLQNLLVGQEWMDAEVVVTDAHGEPIRGARVELTQPREAGTGKISKKTDREGLVQATLNRSFPTEVRIRASHHLDCHIENASFPLLVALDPAPVVMLELQEPLPAVEGLSHWRIELRRRGRIPPELTQRERANERRTFQGQLRETVAPGVSVLRFEGMAPGTYKVSATPGPAARRNGRPKTTAFAIGTIEVGGLGAEKHTLAIDSRVLVENARRQLTQ